MPKKTSKVFEEGEKLTNAAKDKIYAVDPVKYIEEQCKIKDEVGYVKPFILWNYQRELIEYLKRDDYRYLCILKGRGIGFSELMAAFIKWKTRYTSNILINMLSITELKAISLLDKIRFMNDYCDSYFKDVYSTNSNTKLLLKKNNSSITSLTSSPDSARGDTTYLTFWDEVAFSRDHEETWTTLKPTLRQKGRIVAGSTPKGMGNTFHYMYKTDNRFTKFCFDWRHNPLRDEQWAIDEGKDHPDDPKKRRDFAQEHGCSFVGSVASVFNMDILGEMQDKLEHINPNTLLLYKEPIRYQHNITIWEEYNKNDSYAIGADVSDEQLKGDYSVAYVVSKITNKVVACIRGHYKWSEFASLLFELSILYGNALIGVEDNNHGHVVLEYLKQYNRINLYYQKKYDNRYEKWTSKIGWTTNKKTKPKAIGELEEIINNRNISFYHQIGIDELATFVYQEHGNNEKMEAMEGFYDDCVMALAIAFQVLKDVKEPIKQTEQKPRQWLDYRRRKNKHNGPYRNKLLNRLKKR